MAYYDYEILREQARGRWEQILLALAPELSEALEKAPRHAPCPVHGGKDGFRFFKDYEDTGGGICNTCGPYPNGFMILQWLRGWDFPQALAAVAEVLGNGMPAPRNGNGTSVPVNGNGRKDDNRLRALLKKTWVAAVPLDHAYAMPARLYLRRRGLSGPIPDCRCHPDLPYFEGGEIKGQYAALVFILRDVEGRPVTLHRIYLDLDGRKAPVASPKKTMPYPSDRKLLGALVRLGYPKKEPLGLAEGIETALAVREATGQVCWAATSAAFLEAAALPSWVRRVTIWADNDLSGTGQKAALRLAERLKREGRKVKVHIPDRPAERKSWDWADVLALQGPGGFPGKQAGIRKAAR